MPRVEVKLHAMLRDRLPPGSRGTTAYLEMPEATTVQAVLDRLDIPPEWRQLVVLNDEEVAPDQWPTSRLQDGDRLSVFPPLAGGAPL